MPLFGRKNREPDVRAVRATALVVEAADPIAGPGVFAGEHGMLRILVDVGSGPKLASGPFRNDKDHWLVAGMEIPVTIDPADPDRFQVDWEEVPPIEDRVTANDPTLADPIGAKHKVNAALLAAGLPDLSRAGPDRFTEALDNAAREPAPEGKTRAVVVIATIEMHLDEGDRRQTVVEGWPSAVLAVNVPGRPPYAVFKHRFHVRRKGVFADLTGAGLPAFVSSDDPNDVEVAWDEIPSLMSQIGQRISDDLQTAQTDITQMQEEMTAAVQQAMQHPPGAPPGFAGLPEGIRDTMARNAKLALQVIKDPAQRQMLITQYRAAGITLDEEDLAT